MDDGRPLLDRRVIEAAFRQLGERLAGRGTVAEVYVFGAAAIVLAYDPRRATGDIDAVFEPRDAVLEEARAVAGALGLPGSWLNEWTRAHLAPGGDPAARPVYEHPGLRASVASAEHLLAMMVIAARRRDAGDIELLVRHLGIDTVDEVLARCAEIFPDEPVPDRARLILEDVLDRG